MISFDFEYYRPQSITNAADIFQTLEESGKNPVFYAGGTEIISMARMSSITTGAVIDVKEIPELKAMEFNGDDLVIGAGVTLTQIHEANLFPLLAQACARVADHTIQNKITLGGNLCGTIIYREAVLPLLLTNAYLVIASVKNARRVPINEVFSKRMQLNRGELLVQVHIPRNYVSCPYVHVKRTKEDKIHYPLLTVCALLTDNQVRAAFSGLVNFPFRSIEMEEALNDINLTLEQRVEQALNKLPATVPDNLEGSAGYRTFILKHLLTSIVNELETGNVTNS